MIKLVVIDFDDTLSQTEEACFYAENEAARQLGFPPMTREIHRKNWGKPLEDAIVERIQGIDPKAFMQKINYVHQQFVEEGRFDHITENNLKFLDELTILGKSLAILTSRAFQEVKHLLQDTHPLAKRIEKFYHKDNSEYVKPDPRIFNKILKDFSVTPEEATYIGDSLDDAKAAKYAGLHFIAVLESGLRRRDDFKSLTHTPYTKTRF